MKILVINKYGPNHPRGGGAEKRLEEVFTRVSDDHDVHLLTAHYSGANFHAEHDGITIHRCPLARGIVLTHLVLLPLLPLYALWLQPDLVYDDISVAPWLAHTTCFWLPHVAIVHNFNGDEFINHGKTLRGWFHWILDSLTLAMYKHRPMIVVSEHMQQRLEHHGFTNVTLIHNGVDDHTQSMKPSDTPFLLYLGRLAYRKGTDLLLDAWPYIQERTDDVELHIAGDNQNGYDIPDDIQYHGYVSDEKKHQLLDKAWLVLTPSRWEGYGIVALEAAAAGTYTLANDAPGLREAVKQGVTGEFVDYTQPERVAQHITELTQEVPGNPETMGRYAETYTWKKAAKETEELLIDST